MYTFFIIIHVIVSIFLILVVLLQKGKGADMGSAFGGSSSTMFGVRGQTTFIHKLTAGMALMFMVLSVVLASLSSRGISDLENEVTPPTQEAGMSGDVNADDAKDQSKQPDTSKDTSVKTETSTSENKTPTGQEEKDNEKPKD